MSLKSNLSDKIIQCNWASLDYGAGIHAARIVDRSVGVEGIDVNRFRCARDASLNLNGNDGHILSLLAGSAQLRSNKIEVPLTIGPGVHVYIPPDYEATLTFLGESSFIHAATEKANARGRELLVHDEKFLSAVRFVLTPQYLSRRAFLHRDETITSKSGDPIAWFHTTMFDTLGLPPNQEGLAVFKMSYDYQTEANVVYDVGASAKVRFAQHPYQSGKSQVWSDWSELSSETTYYLNESATGDDVETYIDPLTSEKVSLRNRHEIFIEPNGHVSLCCLFDPGPTGRETHLPGDYSSYGPVSETLGTPEYRDYLEQVEALDEMVRSLSMAVALDPSGQLENSPYWPVFQSSLDEARKAEAKMLEGAGRGRESIIEPWRIRVT